MEISVISLVKLSRIVEYDLKAWHNTLETGNNNDESHKDRIAYIFADLIVKHIEAGIGQMHREDRNLIISAVAERGYSSDTVDIVINDRLRAVYINTLRNRLSRIDQLGDVLKRELDILGVGYTDDDDDEEE